MTAGETVMAQPKRPKPAGSKLLRPLIDLLIDDWKTLNGKYPDQALFALGDKRVAAAIEQRFEDKSNIKDIKSLSYNFETGLNGIYFEFTADAKRGELAMPNAFLILMDGNCQVAALIDPFDPQRPNAFAPSLKQGEQPFVLSRPSVAEQLVFNEADLRSIRIRSR